MRGLTLTQVLSGLFASAVAPVSQSLVSESVQETSRGFAFSILAMCAGFGGSASAFLYGLFSWQVAYRMMGGLTLTLSLWILLSLPADVREKQSRSLMREIGAELEQLKEICCIPTFLALLLHPLECSQLLDDVPSKLGIFSHICRQPTGCDVSGAHLW